MNLSRLLQVCVVLCLVILATSLLGVISTSAAVSRVDVLLLQGTVENGLSSYLCRGVREAEQRADAVWVEINTFGGRVDAATEARDCLLNSQVPVYTYVTERAWSAGALIALAGKHIAMSPGSSIGAAEPRPNEEKVVSALRAEFAATAERYGRDPQVAEAMVDARIAIPGVVEKGELLTLRASEAKRLGYADVVAESRAGALKALFPAGADAVEIPMNWAERAARYLTDPTVSSILLTLAFLGLLAELASPGWGLPGIAAALSLGLFFGGRLVVGLVGWEVVLLFVAGLALLLVEVFVIPGFGITGVFGLIGIFASLFLAYPDPTMAMKSLSITVIATVVLGALLLRQLFKRDGRLRRVVLATRQAKHEGYVAVQSTHDLVGREGKAVSTLRPAGVVDIGGQRVDAVSDGSFITAGRKVQVIRVEGMRVVVEEVSNG